MSANVSTPTVLDATMDGILYALAAEQWTHYSDVDASIRSYGGDVNRKVEATKRLRDIGFAIVVDKHRQHTMWKVNPTDDELARYDRGTALDTYSRFVTNHRAYLAQYGRRPSAALATTLQASEMACVYVGRSLGLTLGEIAHDLVTVTP